jgi:hypothetical protein
MADSQDDVNKDLYRRVNEQDMRLTKVETWRDLTDPRLNTFITRIEFTLVKIITYGIAGTALLSVLTALISKVIVKS